MIRKIIFALLVLLALVTMASRTYAIEISGSPFATEGAPLPAHINSQHENVIVVDPREHNWGAYDKKGKLVRWGIATAGSDRCEDTPHSCRTTTGYFRIHSLGNSDCISHKYDGAAMPYCMFFNGSQALHGSTDIQFENRSHGCVRVHIDDAMWLRYHFVEGPNESNHFRGTQIIIRPY
jgi:hypothetical protein